MLKRIFLFSFLFFLQFSIQSKAIEEIIVTGDWRDTTLKDADSSLVLITDEDIRKHHY